MTPEDSLQRPLWSLGKKRRSQAGEIGWPKVPVSGRKVYLAGSEESSLARV